MGIPKKLSLILGNPHIIISDPRTTSKATISARARGALLETTLHFSQHPPQSPCLKERYPSLTLETFHPQPCSKPRTASRQAISLPQSALASSPSSSMPLGQIRGLLLGVKVNRIRFFTAMAQALVVLLL